MEINGSLILVFLDPGCDSMLLVALGMICGSLLTMAPLPFAYMVVLLLAIFGGAWMDLEAIGGAFQTVGDLFPFAHALDATRDVMIDGAGFGAIASDLYWVLGYTVLVVALALVFFRRKMTE